MTSNEPKCVCGEGGQMMPLLSAAAVTTGPMPTVQQRTCEERGIICEIRGVCHPSRRTDVFFISDIFWHRSGAMFWHLLMIVGSWRGQAGQAADTLQPLRLRTQFLLGAAG